MDTQIINMPFSQGLDTKTDPFQIPLGKLLVLQNAVFNSPGVASLAQYDYSSYFLPFEG